MSGIHKKNFYDVKRVADHQKVQDQDLMLKAKRLPPGAVWIDNGAGLARPQSQMARYYREGEIKKLPHMFALGIAKPKKGDSNQAVTQENVDVLQKNLDQFPQYFMYRETTFEDFDFANNGLMPFESVDLMTSYYGGASYTLDLDFFLRKAFNSLKVGGEFWIKDSGNTVIYTISGKKLNLVQWLAESVKGVTTFPTKKRAQFDSEFESIFIKIDSRVIIPKLYLVRAEVGTPPGRVLTEMNPVNF